MGREPRILFWDIETTHNLTAVFRLFNNDYISHDNLLQERYIVCAAWKWLGESTVHSFSTLDCPKHQKAHPHDDQYVLQKLHQILSAADVIVAHNGDQYDLKFAETRMLYHGLSPLPPIPTIDTLKVAKSRFMFNSNKLDYLGQFLGLGKKIHTDNSLWLRVLQGEPAAIREMVTYNKQDIVLLEKVFTKLRPYIANHVSRELFGQQTGCPRCGSLKFQSRGLRYAVTRTYQRYQCSDCGGWWRNRLADKPSTSTRVL